MLCDKGKTLTLLIWAPTLPDQHPKQTYLKIQSNKAYMLLYQFGSVQANHCVSIVLSIPSLLRPEGRGRLPEKTMF
jgi:hypothetical protein